LVQSGVYDYTVTESCRVIFVRFRAPLHPTWNTRLLTVSTQFVSQTRPTKTCDQRWTKLFETGDGTKAVTYCSLAMEQLAQTLSLRL
jgi:hypothetical protein